MATVLWVFAIASLLSCTALLIGAVRNYREHNRLMRVLEREHNRYFGGNDDRT